jgi:hypothetical protein
VSIPVPQLTCDRCRQSFSHRVLYGLFDYELADGTRLPLERRLGWCSACDTVVAAENLDPAPALDERTTVGRKLQGINGISALLPSRRRAVVFYRKQLDELELRLAMLQRRQYGPRCLDCGNVEITMLPATPDLEADGPHVPAGWKHPGCGGEMQAYLPSMRFSYNHRLRIYDAEGNFLRETDEEE